MKNKKLELDIVDITKTSSFIYPDIIDLVFEICCFLGKARAGKTLSMVSAGYFMNLKIKKFILDIERKIYHKKYINELEMKRYTLFTDFKVVSNLNLNEKYFGKYERLTPEKLIEMYLDKVDLKHKLILIDDIFKSVDNRDFMRTKEISGKKINFNKVFSYFITEIGKKQNILLYVSHFESLVEVRLRKFTEKFIYCRKGEFINTSVNDINLKVFMEFPDYYDLDLNLEKENIMVIQQNILRNFIDFENDLEIRKKKVDTNYILAKDFFKMYNTEEII